MTLSTEKLKWLLSDEIGGINSWVCSDRIRYSARALIEEVLELRKWKEELGTEYAIVCHFKYENAQLRKALDEAVSDLSSATNICQERKLKNYLSDSLERVRAALEQSTKGET